MASGIHKLEPLIDVIHKNFSKLLILSCANSKI
jgi:hypothetical protein